MAKYRKLGRTSNQRKALLRNQVTQLLYHGKIRTTEAKAGLYYIVMVRIILRYCLRKDLILLI